MLKMFIGNYKNPIKRYWSEFKHNGARLGNGIDSMYLENLPSEWTRVYPVRRSIDYSLL